MLATVGGVVSRIGGFDIGISGISLFERTETITSVLLLSAIRDTSFALLTSISNNSVS